MQDKPSFDKQSDMVASSTIPTASAVNPQELRLGPYAARVEECLKGWDQAEVSRRIWDKDPTVWRPDIKAVPFVSELTNRLGWLTIADEMQVDLTSLADFAGSIREAGFTHVVLLGMGGSSMAPEVFMRVFGAMAGFPPLIVLDTTHPDAIRQVSDNLDLGRTLFIVSSKSGGTIETLSLFQFFYQVVGELKPNPGENFIVITDPSSKLEALAMEMNFRLVFSSPPEVGGRYSALTYFGLVPAALIGVDLKKLIGHALAMTAACGADVPASWNPALMLGVALGELARAGRDKVTFLISPALAAFGVWVEQLIAESTGKEGRGILPVVDEAPVAAERYGKDRVFVILQLAGDQAAVPEGLVGQLEAAGHPIVQIQIKDKESIAQELFRWELATAAAGAALGINPFDQPNVEAAKVKAKEFMAVYQKTGELPQPAADLTDGLIAAFGSSASGATDLRGVVAKFVQNLGATDYLALMAYLPPSAALNQQLQQLRMRLRDHCGVAASVGYGPRFLHSTGQLHKGDGNHGVFLQITHDYEKDLTIPGQPYSFGVLITAQALGDRQALLDAGRRVLRLHIQGDLLAGLASLGDAMG
jgi:glucose-6-phosphate isomerase